MPPITIDPNSQSDSLLDLVSGGQSPLYGLDNSTSLFNSGTTTWPP
jgi:hypothetical protein